MNLDFQTAAVLLVVVTASAYLARSAWQTIARRKQSACGGCGTCPSNTENEEPQVVSVAQLAETSHAAARQGANHNGAERG